MEKLKKYNRIAITTKAFGDYKVLAFVSGNSIAELKRVAKAHYSVRNNGLVSFEVEDRTFCMNSNKF